MKYVIGNNLVATMAAYLLPNVKHIKPIDKDLDSWNIETFYIPYYCLDFVKLVFPGANVSKYEMRTMYDMRKTLSAVKPKNFDQISVCGGVCVGVWMRVDACGVCVCPCVRARARS